MSRIGLTVAGVATSGAHAAVDPLAAAVVHQERSLRAEAAAVGLLHGTITTAAQARRAIPKLRLLSADFDRAAAIVARVPAASPRERLARRDWTAGMRRVALGWTQTIGVLHALEHRRLLVFWSAAERAARTDRSGLHLLVRAQRLLHLPLRPPATGTRGPSPGPTGS